MFGVDLSGCDRDGPFQRALIHASGEHGVGSHLQLIIDILDGDDHAIRQLVDHLAGARGHWVEVAAPEQVAGRMQTWFEIGAADGFKLMAPYFTGGLDVFLEEVVPILRRHGLFREEYED